MQQSDHFWLVAYEYVFVFARLVHFVWYKYVMLTHWFSFYLFLLYESFIAFMLPPSWYTIAGVASTTKHTWSTELQAVRYACDETAPKTAKGINVSCYVLRLSVSWIQMWLGDWPLCCSDWSGTAKKNNNYVAYLGLVGSIVRKISQLARVAKRHRSNE